MTEFYTVATGLQFPEGPAFDRAGRLHIVEIAAGRVLRFETDGSRTQLGETAGGPNGLAFDADERLFVANNGGLRFGDDGRARGISRDHAGGWIEVIEPDGRFERLFTHYEGEILHNPNDIAVDSSGDLFFTDSHFPTRDGVQPGHVYFARPTTGEIVRIDTDLAFPNGIGISPEGKLIVAESFTSTLWMYDVVGQGKVEGKRRFATLPKGHLPDGFCFDTAGNILCAGADGGAVHVIDSSGDLVQSIAVEDPLVTNVAFGVGAESSTLYITESLRGRVVAVAWDQPGNALPNLA